MKLFKKPVSKDLVPSVESPVFGKDSILYAMIKR